jgi:hypothetical protein
MTTAVPREVTSQSIMSRLRARRLGLTYPHKVTQMGGSGKARGRRGAVVQRARRGHGRGGRILMIRIQTAALLVYQSRAS